MHPAWDAADILYVEFTVASVPTVAPYGSVCKRSPTFLLTDHADTVKRNLVSPLPPYRPSALTVRLPPYPSPSVPELRNALAIVRDAIPAQLETLGPFMRSLGRPLPLVDGLKPVVSTPSGRSRRFPLLSLSDPHPLNMPRNCSPSTTWRMR